MKTKLLRGERWRFLREVGSVRRGVVGFAVGISIPLALISDATIQQLSKPIEYARAQEPAPVVLIEAYVNWDATSTVERKIREAFPTASSTMVKVAKCESGLQIDAYNPLSKDYGIFQINSSWLKEAKEMGFDVKKPADNIAFAQYLHKKHGLSDWRASKGCWSK